MEYWAIARYDLALSDNDWLQMTPRQLVMIWRRRINEMRSIELMLSRLTAAVYNSGFVHPKTPFGDTDFMLHPLPKPPAEPPELLGDAFIRKLKTVHWAQETVN